MNANNADYQQLANSLLQLENSLFSNKHATDQATAQATAAFLAAAASQNLSEQSLDPKWNLLQEILHGPLKNSAPNGSSNGSEHVNMSSERESTPNCDSSVADNSTGCSDSDGDDSCSEVDNNSSKGESSDGAHGIKKRGSSYVDEKLIRIPLMRGWQRECLITSIATNGIAKGDVCYLTPCGLRLHSYPEVLKYLSRCKTEGLDRNNFSFNAKNLLGIFYISQHNKEALSLLRADTEEKLQQSKESNHPGLVILSADEMKTKIIEMTKGRGRYAQRLIKNSGSESAKAYGKINVPMRQQGFHDQSGSATTQSSNLQKLLLYYAQNPAQTPKNLFNEKSNQESANQLPPSFINFD